MTDTADQPDQPQWGLLYPFMCTTSHGGPYDDQPFVAGAQLGRADMALQAAQLMGADRLSFMVYTDLVGTLELAGMARGFPVLVAEQVQATDEYPAMPEWTQVTFHRGQTGETP